MTLRRYFEVLERKGHVVVLLVKDTVGLSRSRGMGAAAKFAWTVVRGIAVERLGPTQPAKSNALDKRYGTDTAENVKLHDLDIESPNYRYAVYYHPTHFPILIEILERLAIRHEDYTFIDYGSGKGLVLLKAAGYPFKKVIGVEFARELHDTASRNMERYPAELCRSKIELVHADAVKFTPPPGNLILYFFEPFEAPVMRQVIARIEGLTREKTDVMVACVWSDCRRVSCKPLWDAVAFLTKVDEGNRWTIYRAKS